MNISTQLKSLIMLHFIVVIFGFTGILGKLITVPSDALVWHRMLFASISLGGFLLLKGKSLKMSKKALFFTLATGLVIAAHWVTFFEAIKQSNVSITLAALASTSMFTAILEPLFFKRKVQAYEFLLGALVIIGLYFIFQFETENKVGIFIGLLSALFASLFTVINGKLIKQYDSSRISFYELSGGVIGLTLYSLIHHQALPDFDMSQSDWLWIIMLAVFATAFAFVVSVEVMKDLSPFTVSLSINLEPVYGIVLAYFIFGEDEQMSLGFYLGTAFIISSLFINSYIKKRLRKKAALH